MLLLYRALALCPGEIPAELGPDYSAACDVFGLGPDPDGYALYLVDTIAGRRTWISRDLPRLRAALDAASGGRRQFLLGIDPGEAQEQLGWPDQLGGTPWCQFCRDPRPARVYDGPLVEVLLAVPAFQIDHWPDVAGTEITGRTEWFACADCHALIEARDYDALWRRCVPYSEPMPVQAAWRQFWADHGPALPYDPPDATAVPSPAYVISDGWSPAVRRRLARDLARDWAAVPAVPPLTDDTAAIDLRPYREDLAPLITRILTEAWSLTAATRPSPGAISSRRVHGTARLLTAAGRGWSLVARTDGPAIMICDQVPCTGIDITRDDRFPGLLDGLTAAAART